ncbi:hypothetical protein [Reyranella sp.]|uniref:hypothetical protein n=1 Tax=Reyranella sp. TaxID=1929291 RepID=UPI003BAAEA37
MARITGVILCGAALIAPLGGVLAQVPKIDGYDGYRFGMTIEEATKVKTGLSYVSCDFKDVVGCIQYPVTVSAFPAQVSVQFKGATPRVVQIVVSFDSLREPNKNPCRAISKEVFRLMAAKYGDAPLVKKGTATWASPNGGAVEMSSLCLDEATGMNVIVYRPSASL